MSVALSLRNSSSFPPAVTNPAAKNDVPAVAIPDTAANTARLLAAAVVVPVTPCKVVLKSSAADVCRSAANLNGELPPINPLTVVLA